MTERERQGGRDREICANERNRTDAEGEGGGCIFLCSLRQPQTSIHIQHSIQKTLPIHA